jgi:hypothetical protein
MHEISGMPYILWENHAINTFFVKNGLFQFLPKIIRILATRHHITLHHAIVHVITFQMSYTSANNAHGKCNNEARKVAFLRLSGNINTFSQGLFYGSETRQIPPMQHLKDCLVDFSTVFE